MGDNEWLFAMKSFSNQGRIRQGKERDGLRFSSALPKIQWVLTATAPMAIRLLETFAFTFFLSKVNVVGTDHSQG